MLTFYLQDRKKEKEIKMKLSYLITLGVVGFFLNNETVSATEPCPEGGIHDSKNFMCVVPPSQNEAAFAAGHRRIVGGRLLNFYPSCPPTYYFSTKRNPGKCQKCDDQHHFNRGINACVSGSP